MNKYQENLERRLERLGNTLRSQPSVIEKGMQTIEQIQPGQKRRHAVLKPAIKSGLGVAACLALGVFLWFLLAGPTTTTFADVQSSLDSKAWVLIQYSDGTQQWANLRERRSFYTYRNDLNFYAGMRDHINGIWRYYHSNWGQQIHEQPFTPRPYPQSPWEYAVGDWEDNRVRAVDTLIEKFTDTIADKQVIRFDTYYVGPLGIRSIYQQVWADPETRLPLRIRKYSGPNEEGCRSGDFSFPPSGPSSIYDLGAPHGLQTVTNWGVIEPAAQAIVEAAKQAQQRLPLSMRIVKKNTYKLSISYRYGNKFRSESYGVTDANHENLLPIEPPQSNEHIREWALNNLTLFDLCIFDGRYEYSYTCQEALWKSPEIAGPTLDVRQYDGDWIYALLPMRQQWPYITNVGPMWVLKNEPGTPPGCVLLRYQGAGVRRDWYIDSERDNICVRQLEFREDPETDQWILEDCGLLERTGLTRLSSGQWYAATTRRLGYQPEQITCLDVTLLTDSEVRHLTGKDSSTAFFDGEKLLRKAMANGTCITFWVP